jgi:hypothetical protein
MCFHVRTNLGFINDVLSTTCNITSNVMGIQSGMVADKNFSGLFKYPSQGIRDYVYARKYWVFGLCPSPGILKTREHDVSETGCVPVLS